MGLTKKEIEEKYKDSIEKMKKMRTPESDEKSKKLGEALVESLNKKVMEEE
jgi:hypothetical protein